LNLVTQNLHNTNFDDFGICSFEEGVEVNKYLCLGGVKWETAPGIDDAKT
jgi:hypothetical protein